MPQQPPVIVQQAPEVSQNHVIAVVPDCVALNSSAGRRKRDVLYRYRPCGVVTVGDGGAQPAKLAQDPVEAVLGVVEDAPVVVDEVSAALVLQLPFDGGLEERRHPSEVIERFDDHVIHVSLDVFQIDM